MSSVHVDIADPDLGPDDEPDDRDDLEVAALSPSAGSLLGRLHAERDRLAAGSSTVLPVGRSSILAARYRPLTDTEEREIAGRAERVQKLAKRTGQEDQGDHERELGGLMLVHACVELLWVDDDGSTRPLVDALTRDGVDTQGLAPLRYDRRTAHVLGLDSLPADPSSVQVALELHRWEESYAPLGVVLDRYTAWRSGEQDQILDSTVQGI